MYCRRRRRANNAAIQGSGKLLLVWGCLPLVGAGCVDDFQPEDIEGPTVVSVGPEGSNVSLDAVVEVSFSEALDDATVHAASVQLIGPAGVVPTVMERATPSSLTLTPEQRLREGRRYVVWVAHTVRDVAGNPVVVEKAEEGSLRNPQVDFRHTFSTVVTVPEVASSDPAHGATDVPKTTTALTVIFNEPMDPSTIHGGAFTAGPDLGGVVSYDADTMSATLTFAKRLREGRTYTATLAPQIADVHGIPLATEVLIRFTVEAVAPQVAATLPADGSSAVAVDLAALEITFNEAMDPGSVTRAVPPSIVVTPPVQGVWQAMGDRAVLTLAASLVSNTTYGVQVSQAVRDEDGIAMAAGASFTFSTADAPDNNAPSTITDLLATARDRSAVQLDWTAPGDDVDADVAKGAVATIDLRYSLEPLVDFPAARAVPGSVTPQTAGASQSLTVAGAELDADFFGQTFYFAAVSSDGANDSAVSNMASVQLGPTVTALEPGQAGAQYGMSVAAGDFDGDGVIDLAVGAPTYQGAAGEETGAVFLHLGQATSASVVIVGRHRSGHFGAAVLALDVDADAADELVVAAPDADARTGIVYVFADGGVSASGAADASQTLVGASLGVVQGGQFGAALSKADVNGDGTDDLLAGAPSQGPHAGAVYALPRDGTGLDATAPVTFTRGEGGDRFGAALTVGDINGDGANDLVIGAPATDLEMLGVGGVALFLGTAQGISPTTRAAGGAITFTADVADGVTVVVDDTTFEFDTASDGMTSGDVIVDVTGGATPQEARDALLAVLGAETDVTATAADIDSIDLVAAATGSAGNSIALGTSDPTAITLSGATLMGGVVAPAAVIHGGEAYQRLGQAVSFVDLTGDGLHELAVGAPGRGVGEVWLLPGDAGWGGEGFVVPAAVVHAGPSDQSQYGLALASVVDLLGDGTDDLLIGAPAAVGDHGGKVGAVFVLHGSASGLAAVARNGRLPGAAPFGKHGQAIIGLGDIDGDGRGDFAVSAPLHDNATGWMGIYR